MEIPVYLFTGFLEAGKTSFIKETMLDPNFNDEKKQYLVITCEEGEVEFEAGEFPDNVHFSSFDDVQLLTPDRLNAMAKRSGADIVVVEYNGMWNVDAFYNALPKNWMVYQEIMIADSSTIISYNANMRQLVVDKLTSCEMVVFNRFKPEYDKMALHKIVRGVSKRANICYEDIDGEIEFDDIEDGQRQRGKGKGRHGNGRDKVVRKGTVEIGHEEDHAKQCHVHQKQNDTAKAEAAVL